MGKEVALYIDRNHQRQTHICRRLELLGLELHKARNIQAAKEMVKKRRYRLVLIHLDTMGNEIFKFCSFIRAGSSHTIIMVLMADVRISIEEKLFDHGVNDVVTGKQISARVLARRVRAHLLHCIQPSWPRTNTIRLKDTIIDFARNEVWCNGASHRLRGILADLLKYFLNNPNRVISRKELWESHIWADSVCSSAKDGGKTFDMGVSKLRKIIEPDPSRPQIIKSVRGIGWKLAADFIERTEG